MEPSIFKSYREWLEHEQMPKGKKAALVAAMELFAETGFDGTSTSQIAEHAGISQATIFKYFHTKQDLLLAIVKPVMQHLFPEYRDEFFLGMSKCETLPDLIHFIVTDRYAFISKNAEVVKILVMEMMTNQEIRELLHQLIATNDYNFLSELMGNFQRTGELRDDIDSAAILRVIGGQLITYTIQRRYAPGWVGDEATDLRNITAQIIRTISQ
ncbi:TetR/AcrR family transcriptional regulator [Levilactobacillus senmaizukei]|uniref:TetR/AcrR family transcriptional regulator n=1 Tax=Levilactobacillus senmaizukei TaxID=431273 RepID=UPI000ABB1DC9|nr:TetR/AcrR family transcriptional regulator [Levilactobacillus senmaizukei]